MSKDERGKKTAMKTALNRTPAAGLRRQAEEQLQRQSGAVKTLPPEQRDRLLHELQVHQIELEIQNENLRQVQQELERVRDRYIDLYDFAPVGYLTINPQGTIIEANLTIAAQLGLERGRLIRKPLSRFIQEGDQNTYYLYLKRLFDTRTPEICEVRLVHQDGTAFHAWMELVSIGGPDGTPVGRIAVSDITERVRMEETLRQAYNNLQWQVEERTAALKHERDMTQHYLNDLAAAHAALQKQIRQSHRVLQQIATVQEDERRRISLELHDRTSQTLSALLMGFKVLENSRLSPAAQTRLDQLERLANTLIDEMHTLAWELHPPPLKDHGLTFALQYYTEAWSQRHGLPVDFHSRIASDDLPFHIKTTIYRIVQELLTNVLKHAEASRVGVLLEGASHQVVTIVEDNGQGFDPEPFLSQTIIESQGRLGLIGIQERLHLVDGELQIESTPGQGTTVFVRIPLPL
jgi:PAS domain S-box-containing protein